MSVKLTIITVTYNCRDLLPKTMASIRRQRYPDIEYIIVDGNSSDGTQDIIKKNKDMVAAYISEPDKGIYDAMNKGLAMASGDYIWFINAGDEVYAADTVEKLFSTGEIPDVFYGDTMIVDPEGREIGLRRLKPPKKLTWKSYQWGQVVSHQAFIPRRAITPRYDLSFKHSADTDWQIKILRKAEVIKNTGQILAKFLDGGHSKKNIPESLKERFRIMIKNYGLLRTAGNHIIIGLKFFWFLARNKRF